MNWPFSAKKRKEQHSHFLENFDCSSCRIRPTSLMEADLIALAEAFYLARDCIRSHKLKGLCGGTSDGGSGGDVEVFASRVAYIFLDAFEKILPGNESKRLIIEANYDPSKFPTSLQERISIMILMIDEIVALIGFDAKVMPLAMLKAYFRKAGDKEPGALVQEVFDQLKAIKPHFEIGRIARLYQGARSDSLPAANSMVTIPNPAVVKYFELMSSEANAVEARFRRE